MQLEGREDYQVGPWRSAPQEGAAPPPLGSPANPDDKNVLAATGRTPFDFVLGASSHGFVRNVVFVQPKKPPQSVDANCVQRQQFAVFQGEFESLSIVEV